MSKDSVGFAFLAGLGGFIGTWAGKFYDDRRQERAQQRQLLSAFQGEILSLLGLIARRKYVEGWKDAVAKVKEGTIVLLHANAKQEYFNVFKKNVDKIGLLPNPFPGAIVTFYANVFSVLEDLDVSTSDATYLRDNPQKLLQRYEDDAKLWEQIVNDGKKIVEAISRELNIPQGSENTFRFD